MAMRETLSRWLGAKASIIGLATDELPDRALEKGYDDATLLSVYGDDAWPYILNNKVGEQASQAPLVVGRVVTVKGKEEFQKVSRDHPVQHLFDNPNELMDGGEFIHLLVTYMGLTGHSPIEVVKPLGQVIGAPGRAGRRQRVGFELQLVNPGPWRIVANRDGTIKGYLWLQTSDRDLKWTPDLMTYLRWPNPANRWYGQGHIQAVRHQVMAEEYAAERDKRFEKNLGVPPGILSSKMPLGEPQAEELQKRWAKATGGFRNAGKIAVLGSETTYQAIQQSARDSEWAKQRLDRVEIMAGAIGIPLPLVRMQDATFSNVQDARAEFWEGTLQPRLNRIARMISTRLLPLITSEPLEARFDYDHIEALGENDLEAAQTATAWSNTGGVTVNEIRKRLGLDAMTGPVGERLIIPTTVSLQSPDEVETNAALGQQAQQATIETTLNPPQPPAAKEPPPKKAKAESDANPGRDAVLSPVRVNYARDLGSYFGAQRNGILNAVNKALSSDEAATILERAIEVIRSKRFRDRLRRISQGPIETAVTLGASEAASALGVAVSFAIPASEAALARVTTHLNALGTGIENTTIEDVRRVLTHSLETGLDNTATREALGSLFDDYADWRLDRISLTETTAAYNQGAIGQYRDAGVQLVKVIDGDDPLCSDANGAEWTLEQAENEPLGHPNCRRTWIPLTEDLNRAVVDEAPEPRVRKTRITRDDEGLSITETIE